MADVTPHRDWRRSNRSRARSPTASDRASAEQEPVAWLYADVAAALRVTESGARGHVLRTQWPGWRRGRADPSDYLTAAIATDWP